MRQMAINKTPAKKKTFIPDDENVRYKLNSEFFNDRTKSVLKTPKKQNAMETDDDNIRYKFPTVTSKPKSFENKPKPKSKIKVNFWSSKSARAQLNKNNINKDIINRRHTIGTPIVVPASSKAPVAKVRKRVSFLPSPIFTENHIPMVTVPDDLTIQLNEEEANDIGGDLNNAFHKSNDWGINKTSDNPSRKSGTSSIQCSPRGSKHKRSSVDLDNRSQGNENELEFFSKYVVQKLRRMETNQRIYSENLINTVLMLGQLGKLNGKSKILEA